MNGMADHYEVYYADKLWSLLPAVYRSEDSDQFDVNGPLREMVDRIGAQAAIIRRGIDRMWEDQSIETCDDWLIPYIGALLGTNIVASLDGRGQRLDVAKTIAYRLRKGTLAVIEEIAANITGWDAKAVEFFRRLGRTRYGLDPAIGPRAAPNDPIGQLQTAEGLAGPLTRTGIGGFADLRNVHGARNAHSAFDEFFHTADVRRGIGRDGWYGIPKLGVFVWRLRSFPVGPVTPVPVQGCPGWYTFDPTGRDVPLFAASRLPDAYGDNWISPAEGQVAAPISQALLNADLDPHNTRSLDLYPDAVSVSLDAAPDDLVPVPATELVLRPDRGRFAYSGSPPDGPLVTTYCYGFPSQIGAGPYDRRVGTIAIGAPPPSSSIADGGTALTAPRTLLSAGTFTIADSLTYAGVADLTVSGELTLRAGNSQRSVIRLDVVTPWVITGVPGCCLSLDGLFISGGDIVLQGEFQSVTLSCCTLDPGTSAPGASLLELAQAGSPPRALFDVAADGRELVPTRVWVDAKVTTMTVDRCVIGPIRTRATGLVESLSISNSVVQSIRTSGYGAIDVAGVKDPERFERRIQLALDPVSALLQRLQPQIGSLLGSGASPPFADPPPSESTLPSLLNLINDIIAGPSIYDATAFAAVRLSGMTQSLQRLAESWPGAIASFNRSLLDDAYPLELADATIALGDGTLQLSRCSMLGRIVVHRLEASESILQELALVDDTQDGCVRFSAFAQGSAVPRQFESVQVFDGTPLFTTVDFGQPAYAQLGPLADFAILPSSGASGQRQNTISAGSEDGSEMGAYARDKNPIKATALSIKLQEFMPAGLVPVIVTVT